MNKTIIDFAERTKTINNTDPRNTGYRSITYYDKMYENLYDGFTILPGVVFWKYPDSTEIQFTAEELVKIVTTAYRRGIKTQVMFCVDGYEEHVIRLEGYDVITKDSEITENNDYIMFDKEKRVIRIRYKENRPKYRNVLHLRPDLLYAIHLEAEMQGLILRKESPISRIMSRFFGKLKTDKYIMNI